MQDRYVGDVGDFGKYGLLRSLCGADGYGPALRLGVLWYKFDGKDTSNDGGHIEYICNPSPAELHLRECDRDLYGKMRRLVVGKRRLVTALEASGALPAATAFFNEGLNFDQTPRVERDEKRRKWFDDGLRKVEQAEVVFTDPDNGIEALDTRQLSRTGPKYVYYDDLHSCWKRGQSLVVYHHIGRKGDAETQIASRCKDLRLHVSESEPIAIRFRRRSSRVYFVLPRPEHANRLTARIRAFLASPWGGASPPHFEQALGGSAYRRHHLFLAVGEPASRQAP